VTTPDPLPALIAPFVDDPGRAVLLTDFDGTLADIVDDPASARPRPGVTSVLAKLASRYARVWVVSGRPVAFLLTCLAGTGVRLSGLYGLEWVEGEEIVTHPDAERWRATVADAAARAEAAGPDRMRTEHKGLSVTFHYRGEPELREQVRAWAEGEAARTGLVVHLARMSFELRPPVDRDKGTAVVDAGAGMAAVCFLGDDAGDLPAFDALDRLAAAGAHALRVGVRSREAPAELLDRADVVVDGPAGVVLLLEKLAGP